MMLDVILAHRRSTRGVTLIELLVAMVLGILVAGGIVTIFLSTSSSNRAQTQMARLQEEGRFAVDRISDDLKMANAQYCSSTGGVANSTASGVYLDGLRTPIVYASDLQLPQNTTAWGGAYPVAPTAAYPLPSFLYMRGYECTATACKPADPSSDIPAMGTDIGSRVMGAAVLTVRYLDSSKGWALGGTSTLTSDTGTGEIQGIQLSPGPLEPPATDFKAGDLAMIADCSNALVFAVTGNPNFAPDASKNFSAPRAIKLQDQAAPRFFDFNTAFRTVSYYLQVVTDDGTATGHKTGALMRCDSSTADGCQELVRGVERLDFLYGVEDSSGGTRYLGADDVDSAVGATIPCPPGAPNGLTPDGGCLWRAVKSVELHVLMDGQNPLYTMTAPDMAFTYLPDGVSTPGAPDNASLAIKPADQGFDPHMIRREFTALVMLRNYNP